MYIIIHIRIEVSVHCEMVLVYFHDYDTFVHSFGQTPWARHDEKQFCKLVGFVLFAFHVIIIINIISMVVMYGKLFSVSRAETNKNIKGNKLVYELAQGNGHRIVVCDIAVLLYFFRVHVPRVHRHSVLCIYLYSNVLYINISVWVFVRIYGMSNVLQ